MKPHEPLSSFPVFHGNRWKDIDFFLQSMLGAKVLARPEVPVFVKANSFQTSFVNMWFCSYKSFSPVQVKFPETDLIRVQMQLKGAARTSVGKTEVEITARQGCISPGAATVNFGENYEQLVLRLNKVHVASKLRALTGKELSKIDSALALNLESEQGRHFKDILNFYAEKINYATHASSLVMAELEQALIVSFLMAIEGERIPDLRRETPKASSQQIKRTMDYIEAHWNKAISIEELVNVAGVSARSLFRSFNRDVGCSPMAYAKKVRLQRAYDFLAATESILRISDLAEMCGYESLSHFSADYKKYYGIKPSQALATRK